MIIMAATATAVEPNPYAQANTAIVRAYSTWENGLATALVKAELALKQSKVSDEQLLVAIDSWNQSADQVRLRIEQLDALGDLKLQEIKQAALELMALSKEIINDDIANDLKASATGTQDLSVNQRILKINDSQRKIKSRVITLQRQLATEHGFRLADQDDGN